MRKIVFITSNEWVGWGGSEACWAAAAERLVRDGVTVRASVMKWDTPAKKVKALESAGCRIFYRPQLTRRERIRRRLFTRNGYARHHMSEIATGADLVVVSQGATTDGLLWLEAAKAERIPYALIVQSVSEQWWPPDGFTEQLAAAYESARAAYFVSEANLALCRKQFVTPLRRGHVIRNPFNVRYDARAAWPGNSVDHLSLACVARLDMVQKAQDLLIDVLSLPHWRSRNVRLTFVGSGVNDRSLRRLVQSSKLANIEFAGFVDNIEAVWSKHHALVLASRFEGTPLALVESMLCGRACIATDVGGNRELIRDGVNGFLAKASTVELLDEAMNRAWENRHRLREMGEAAGRDVREWVSEDPTGDFVKELRSLVERPAGAAEADYVVGRPVVRRAEEARA